MNIFKKSKKLFKTIAMMLAMLIITPGLGVFAVEINSTEGTAYLKYDSPTWGKVLPIGNHRYYAPDLRTCYCLNTGALNPTGQDYTEEMNVDGGIETILYWGYPSKNGSEWGISADEYRYCTQLAIWAYQYEAGLSRGLDRTRLQDGTVSLSRLKPVIDFLVEKAHNKELPKFFDVTPNEVNASENGDYLVSEPIQIKSDYLFNDARVSVKSTSDPSLKDRIKIMDMNGNERNLFNSNEKFKIYIPKNARTGELKIKVNARIPVPAVVGYKTPVTGKQDMAIVPMETQNFDVDNVTVKWTGLTGNLKVIKTGDNGEFLTGAKFQLKDMNGTIVEEKTSENGQLTFEGIKADEYILEEVESPKGFLKSEPVKVTVKGGENTEINVVDTQIKGKVAVKKVDKETNKLLQGAEFTIYDGDKAVQTITTDENGYAESGFLNYGKYTMKETKAPNGYLVNDKVWNIDITENGKTYTFDVPDQIIKGKIQMLKIDEENQKPLQGAEFEITQNGKHIETITTNEKGIATSEDLSFGDYLVKEIKAPNKYILNGKEYPVTISENGKTIEITHTNKIIKGKVAVKKTDSEISDLNLEGAEFTVYDNNKNSVATITTNKDGYAESKSLNYGTYTMQETKAPNGYLLNDKIWNIDITENNKTYTYDISDNVIKGKLQIVKVDSENEEKPVANAEFDVVAKNVFGIKEGTVVDHVVTDKNGFAYTKDLRFGEYTFKEVKTPQGYWASDKEYTINITENNKTYVKYVKNSPIQAKLRVIKTDSKDNKPLEGVKFQVRNTDTNKLVTFKNFVGILPIPTKTLTTDKNGEIMTPQPLAYGNYQLEEISPKDGYVGIKPIPFRIDENSPLEDIKDLGTVYTIKVANDRIKGDMELLKVDSGTKEPLSDIEFKVTALDGLMKGQTWDLKSDENGIVSLKDLEYGHYKIEEVKTNWNYVLDLKPIFFDIKENGQVVKLEMDNKKIRANVELIKIDSETKRPLEGAEFELWNGEKLVGTYTTNKDGKIVVKNLEAGNYYFNEIKAPDHYEINQNQDLSFVIDKDGETKTVNAENKVQTGDVDFVKIDVTTGKPIEGAKIEIVGIEPQNKHIKLEFDSAVEGNKFKLPVGKYELRETQAPNGYEISTEVGTFEVKADEVIKAELKNERTTGTLEFTKIDSKTGEGLDGAKIKVECLEGLDKGKVIEFISSKEGNQFTLAKGKYRISETQAPDGYELTTETGEFEITEQGQIIKCNLTNKKFEIVKTGGAFNVNMMLPLGLLLVVGSLGALAFTKRKRA